jgi:uncharacterized protein YndB with AHSA1/START domain
MTTRKTKVITEPGSYEIVVVREFDASCELVFRAHVDAKLFVKWYGCQEMTTRAEHFDPRTGGSYSLLQRIGSGPEGRARGVFHEVVANTRIVQTSEFEGYPSHVVLQTTRFEAIGMNQTKVTKQLVFQSVQDRDAMVEFGVEHGTSESFQKLDEVLSNLSRS